MWVPSVIEIFAKTLMNGVFETSRQPPTTSSSKLKTISKRSSNASKNHRETCSATSTPSLSLSLTSLPVVAVLPLTVIFEIFFECVVFCQISVLMNDFRLKSFYSKSSSNSKTTTLSTSSGSSAAALSNTKFTPSSNNNHHRTYNNSSKSNKVFLYYTPRDPRLRIFQKTKQSSNRPQCKVFDHTKSLIASPTTSTTSPGLNNSLQKLTDDLCNYGELIGGSVDRESEQQQQQQLQLQKISNTISVKLSSNNNTNSRVNCDNLLSEVITSDKSVVAAAVAVAATSAAIFDTLFKLNVIAELQHLEELLKTYTVGVLLSFIYTNVSLPTKPVYNALTTIGIYAKI